RSSEPQTVSPFFLSPLAQFLLQAERLSFSKRVENEVRTSAGSRRPANALNDLCKRLSDPVVLSSEGPWLPDRVSSSKPSTAQVARSPPAVAITKLNC
ncbi:hypothetical protein EV363DRAFT_1211490, partial [Boletus edulis]